MTKTYWAGVIALAGMAMVGGADAAQTPLLFSGPGFSGSLVLTYGPASDSKYPDQGFEITGISGTFTDTNIGIVDAPVTALVPISPTPPLDDPPNVAAPHHFSHFAVATGLPPESRGFITYDNLFWPDGASPTASAFDGRADFWTFMGSCSASAAARSSICSTMASAPSRA